MDTGEIPFPLHSGLSRSSLIAGTCSTGKARYFHRRVNTVVACSALQISASRSECSQGLLVGTTTCFYYSHCTASRIVTKRPRLSTAKRAAIWSEAKLFRRAGLQVLTATALLHHESADHFSVPGLRFPGFPGLVPPASHRRWL